MDLATQTQGSSAEGTTGTAPGFTVIVRYTVSPPDQAELLAVLQRSGQGFLAVPGFRGLTMQRSLDGTQVLVWLRWRSQADSDACFANPVWLEAGRELMARFIEPGRVTMEPQPFEQVLELTAPAAQG